MIEKRRVYYSTDHYKIYVKDANSDYLVTEWIGFQPRYSVPDGCAIMLRTLADFGLSKVLNINSEVKGLWDADWVALDWFPKMKEAGLKHFAWVLSPEPLCAEVARLASIKTPVKDLIKTFDNIEEAEKWLISK